MPFDPTTFWDRHAEQVRATSGADHSSWKRTVFGYREFTDEQIREGLRRNSIPPDPAQPGNGEPELRRSAVQWDGTIRYDPERVGRALDDMLRHAHDQEFSESDLVSWRTGLRAVYQAHAQLLVPGDKEYADGQSAKWDAGAYRMWTESPTMIAYRGWAEATARHDLDAFIGRLELPDRLTAALATVDAEYDDPFGCAAADAMAERIAQTHPHLGKADVLHQIGNQSPADMMTAMSDLIAEGHPLIKREDVPGVVVRAVWDEVDETLHEGFRIIATETSLADRSVAEQASSGAELGADVVNAVRDTLTEVDDYLAEHGAEQAGVVFRAGGGPRWSGNRQASESSINTRRRVEAQLDERFAGRFGDDARRPARKPPSAGWPGMTPNR